MRRRWLVTTLLLTAGFATGCGDLGSLVYFLMPEQKIPPDIKHLASAEKKKDPKALILVRNGPETRFELLNSDKQLAILLDRQLRELCEYNEEHLTLVSPAKVEAFKSDRDNWQELTPAEIGKFFKVDYVIAIDINHLSLYEHNSSQMGIYRGQANLSVKLVDVNQPTDSPHKRDVEYTYPSSANVLIADGDLPEQAFRELFMGYIAKRLAWNFAPHSAHDAHRFME